MVNSGCCNVGLDKYFNYLIVVVVFVAAFFADNVAAAPESKLIPFWNAANDSNGGKIDHSPWQFILDRYLKVSPAGRANLFDYKSVQKKDREILQRYLTALQNLDPRQYSRAEQKAYWINLYNALTVELVLQHYPVSSITKIGRGFFRFGPWDDQVAEIMGRKLTLNNIEHGILRPIYQDSRIHYVVNCASLGCPNLADKAYTSDVIEEMLDAAAVAYVNSPRGVKVANDQLYLSSIYKWYGKDFGNDFAGLLSHLSRYAGPSLKQALEGYSGEVDYHYDWSLNDLK